MIRSLKTTLSIVPLGTEKAGEAVGLPRFWSLSICRSVVFSACLAAVGIFAPRLFLKER